ncbi:MAG TPA: metallophosphoesterase [Microbacteriaceae bacterium]|nr:metallophosphoesterase [Microbacteriaceae bacterium]
MVLVVLTAAALAVGAALWAILIERNLFVLRRATLRLLPPGSPPVRVLHISDVHMAPWQRRKAAWIAGLARSRPDVVVSTGDLLGHRDGLTGITRALEPFRGIPGAFVHGSNDYYGPVLKNPLRYLGGPSREPDEAERLDTEALTAWLRDLGWQDLTNRRADGGVGDISIAWTGVDDPHLGRDQVSPQSETDASWLSSTIRIGVSHAPYLRVLDALTSSGAELIFAGHTHGGQVRLPDRFGGALVTNCDLPRAYARGVHTWRSGDASSTLSISAGLGTSITAPIRFFCRPEATLLTLVAVDA